MNTTKFNFFTSTVILIMLLFPGLGFSDAQQQGALISLSELTPVEQEALLTAIRQARIDDLAAFTAVQSVRDDLPRLDMQKRGRLAVITPALKSIGQKALFPLLERIAVADPGLEKLTPTAWLAWQVGLLEALGMVRDERSSSVLLAVLRSEQKESMVLEAAAAAYGKIGSDQVVQDLIAMTSLPEPKRSAILAGMGHCRRQAIAQHLTALLSETSDQQTALVIARALGRVGSALAWKTDIIAQSGEELPTRVIAARGLIEAYLQFDGEVRQMITRSILLVNHPDTLLIIQELKNRTVSDRSAELDQLVQRFRENPLHRIESK